MSVVPPRGLPSLPSERALAPRPHIDAKPPLKPPEISTSRSAPSGDSTANAKYNQDFRSQGSAEHMGFL